MTVTDYLSRVNELLSKDGYDDYLLRVEQHRVWRPDGVMDGGDTLIGTAQGELADLIIEMIGVGAQRNFTVAEVLPRRNITYGIARILKEALSE